MSNFNAAFRGTSEPDIEVWVMGLQYNANEYRNLCVRVNGKSFYPRMIVKNSSDIMARIYWEDLEDYLEEYNSIDVEISFNGISYDVRTQYGGEYTQELYYKKKASRLSWVKITRIESRGSGFRIRVRGNGRGNAYLYSITRKEEMDSVSFSEDGDTDFLDVSGGEIGYLEDFRDLPLGTCHFRLSSDDDSASESFYLLREYDFTTYSGQYDTNVQLGSYQAVAFRTLTEEWGILINLFYYLASALRGSFSYSRYTDYYPSRGVYITARMYNDLINIADDFMNEIGWGRYDLPRRVKKDEFIKEDFVSSLGTLANRGVKALMGRNSF